MKDDIIKIEITYKCKYQKGKCCYDNPINQYHCNGCYFGQVIDSKSKLAPD